MSSATLIHRILYIVDKVMLTEFLYKKLCFPARFYYYSVMVHTEFRIETRVNGLAHSTLE